jgi:phospholipase/lecithinase/hemolysin
MASASRTGLFCVSIVLCIAALPAIAGKARAQTAFTRIQAFGDSYADTGNLFKILGVPNPAVYPTGRFSGGTNFVDTTSALLGIPQLNFAIGGAKTSGNTVLGGFGGFDQEVQGILGPFNVGPIKIAPSDLVEISIGGNDARQYYQTGGTLAGVPAAAANSANIATAGINTLVADGARTIVFTVGDVSKLPEATGNPAAPIGAAYSQTYNNLMQIALANVARSGVRVEYVDTGLLGTLITANPARYGFTFTGACPVACVGNPALQNQYLFYVDGIHLTSHGFAVLGQYIVNRLNAPLTFAPQGELAQISAMGFASTLFGKLDLFRETYGFASTQNAYAADMGVPYAKAPRLAPVSPWIILHARQWRHQRPAGQCCVQRLQRRQRRRNDRSGIPAQRERVRRLRIRLFKSEGEPVQQRRKHECQFLPARCLWRLGRCTFLRTRARDRRHAEVFKHPSWRGRQHLLESGRNELRRCRQGGISL